MKLLLDQNISFRVVSKISAKFPNAKQVRELKLENASDIDIWHFAKQNHFTIVTFDADFYDLASYHGHPPKIIWLRIGNTTTDGIAELLNEKAAIITDFISGEEQKDKACLEID